MAQPSTSTSAFSRYYSHQHWLRMLGLMTLVSVGLSVLLCLGNPTWWRGFGAVFGYNFCYTTGLWLANSYPSAWLNRRADWTKQPLRRFLITIAYSLIASLTVIVVVSVGFQVLTQRRPLGGMGWETFVFPLAMTVVISLFMHSRSFLLGWRDAAVRAQQLEKESAVARLDSLRRQVDPHFLFNALNALTALVEAPDSEPARAVRFIRQLAQVYRYVLESENQEVVPLREEISFAEAYIFLQKTRLGDALQVELDVPTAAQATFFVPPLALQLLLENAIKHNTAFQTDPLRIRVTLDAAAATLSVRNTLRPRRLPPGEASGRGLQNLAARYAFLTSQPLQIGEQGQEFVVTLPLLSVMS